MTWRPIQDFPGYFVSSWGWVLGPAGRVAAWLKDGYPKVTLRRAGRRLNRFVHVLVAEAFLGPRPSPAHEVLHQNGRRDEPWASNLRWGTRLENQDDKRAHGTFLADCRRKLDERRVRALRRAKAWKRLAKRYGVTPRAAANARNGATWGRVA